MNGLGAQTVGTQRQIRLTPGLPTALDQPRRKAWAGQRPEAEELATATQDASCKTEVGLTQYGDQLFAGLMTDWFNQHPSRFTEITEYMKGVTDRATAVLAS